jgi:hypothetical protein
MPYRKYKNEPTVVDGISFASKKEAQRYSELRLLEKAGAISELELQPRFPLTVFSADGRPAKIATYVADFRYYEHTNRGKSVIVEDTKGMPTPVFKLKRKLFELIYQPLRMT